MGLGSYCRVLSLVQNMQTLGQLFEPLYLQSTGHTWAMEITKPDPIDSKSTDAQMAHYIGWTKANDSIIKSVNMYLSDALC